jgi:hypothetical protein
VKRKDALAALRVAGYHNDQAARVRLLVENRVSLISANEAWVAGVRARAAGVPCSCSRCSATSTVGVKNENG